MGSRLDLLALLVFCGFGAAISAAAIARLLVFVFEFEDRRATERLLRRQVLDEARRAAR